MAENIMTILDEASGVGLQFELTDANGDSVLAGAITSISYTWSDEHGVEINRKTDEPVTPVANPITIKLDKDDTAITETGDLISRLLTITWVYTDAVLGADTQKVKEYLLKISNYVNE